MKGTRVRTLIPETMMQLEAINTLRVIYFIHARIHVFHDTSTNPSFRFERLE